MDISVVIPLLNEEESIRELYDWIASVMQSNRFSYEVLFIDDGSTDGISTLMCGQN
jgi:glycosyltransferase involved in cell wall biosynthesis